MGWGECSQLWSGNPFGSDWKGQQYVYRMLAWLSPMFCPAVPEKALSSAFCPFPSHLKTYRRENNVIRGSNCVYCLGMVAVDIGIFPYSLFLICLKCIIIIKCVFKKLNGTTGDRELVLHSHKIHLHRY